MEEVDFKEFKYDPNDNQKFAMDNINTPQKPYKRNWKNIKDSIKTIYTDGGSRDISKNKGVKHYVGAWSFYDKETNEVFGKAEDNSTNNQMELMACIKALEYLNENGVSKEKQITIATDSEYVYFGILFRCKKWIANNWMHNDMNGNSVPVKNIELWKRLYPLAMERNIFWYKVPAHSGIEGNEKVDINCGVLMDKFIEMLRNDIEN